MSCEASDERIARIESIGDRLDAANMKLDYAMEAIDAARIGIWVWMWEKGGGESLTWDDRMLSLFDTTRARWDNTYLGFLNCLSPECREPVDAALKHSLATGEDYDICYTTATGRRIHGRGKCHFENDRPSRFTGICMECTPAQVPSFHVPSQ